MKRAGKLYQHSPALHNRLLYERKSTMQDNPNTEDTDTQTREFDLYREDWEEAFEPLEKNSFPGAQARI